MKLQKRHAVRAATALGLVAAAAACIDSANPLGPSRPGGPGEETPAAPIELTRLDCTAHVRSGVVECGAPQLSGASADIIYAGQNQRVVVSSSDAEYNSTSHKFTFNVRLRNLLRQAIGTTDGVSPDGSGVKVFMVTNPHPTEGSGAITIDNADGTQTFLGSEPMPFYRYVARLAQFDQSAAKGWQFDVDPSVAAFAFSVAISSPVQFPVGWIETSINNYPLRRTYSKIITATVYNQFGDAIPNAVVTWSSATPTLATVPADSGLVTGRLPGAASIVATSTNNVPGTPGATQTGTAIINVTGTSLVWTAGAASTEWNAPANWDRNVDPVPQDSVIIPADLGSYPVLAENEGIGRVQMADGATLTIGAFNLTASQDVISAPTTGGIVGSTGRVELTATSNKTVAGRFPRTRITGRYTTVGNVDATAALVIAGGRLINAGFRVRSTSR